MAVHEVLLIIEVPYPPCLLKLIGNTVVIEMLIQSNASKCGILITHTCTHFQKAPW